MGSIGLLFDQTRCIGCRACEQACQAEHDQPPHTPQRLDDASFTVVTELPDGSYVRSMCMSCLEPTCVSVCPVLALEKQPEGPVTWDGKRCLGCRYCLMACPFGIPRYEWYTPNPRVRKCDLCVHRVREGRETACASICPTGATLFGEREKLLREARRRLDASPEIYQPLVYGEHEVGGTAVLLLLTVTPVEAGLPASVPEDPLPRLTWNVLAKLPRIIPLWAAFLGGMYWLTDRRYAVALSERQEDDHE